MFPCTGRKSPTRSDGSFYLVESWEQLGNQSPHLQGRYGLCVCVCVLCKKVASWGGCSSLSSIFIFPLRNGYGVGWSMFLGFSCKGQRPRVSPNWLLYPGQPPFLPHPLLSALGPLPPSLLCFPSIMQSGYFIFLWGGCRGLARIPATLATESLPRVPPVGFSDYRKKQTAPSQPFSVLGFWGNSLSVFWLPLWDAGWSHPGVWNRARGGGGRMEDRETVWEPGESEQGWLGELGQTWLSVPVWSTQKCLVTEAWLLALLRHPWLAPQQEWSTRRDSAGDRCLAQQKGKTGKEDGEWSCWGFVQSLGVGMGGLYSVHFCGRKKVASGLSCDCGGRGGYFDLGSEGRGFERIIVQVCVWRMRVCKLREMTRQKAKRSWWK